MIIFGASNVGMVRTDNQDSYLFDSLAENVVYAVVCDGMGGASGGKTASSTAVNAFANHIRKISECTDTKDIKALFEKAVNSANADIYQKSINDNSLYGMGTTLVSVVIINNTAYFSNIGDSRAYLIRNDVINRITHDHSAVQELVDCGKITEEQARNHPNKNIITRALGVEPNVDIDYFTEKLESGDIIVLCTDGITNYIDDLEIPFEILKNNSLENVPQGLIELANHRGGSDNSTVVVIKV